MKPLVLILAFGLLALIVLMGCIGGPPAEETPPEGGEDGAVDEGATDAGGAGAGDTSGTGSGGTGAGTGGTGGTTGGTGTEPGADNTSGAGGSEDGGETVGCDEETGEGCEPVVCDEETGEGCEETGVECDEETGEGCDAGAEEPEWGEDCWYDDDCEFSDDVCIYGNCVTPRCARLSECPVGTEFCFDGECVMKADIYAMFEQCGTREPVCEQRCENCIEGAFRCISSGAGDRSYRICAECAMNDDCNEGYACVHHVCVAPPEESEE